MIIKFQDVLPNPNRDLVRNPFNEEKLSKLMASINKTGFWDNVVVRKNPEGKYEMAYGHHRVEAARRAGLTEANFIVKKFSDAEMIKVMKDENDEAYGFSASSLLESVRAVVKALAEGRIVPFLTETLIKEKKINLTTLRYAPSFIPGDAGRSPASMAYTALSVAEFLGETTEREQGKPRANEAILATLNALHLIEIQELSEASLKGLPLDGGKNGKGLIQKLRTVTEQRASRIALVESQKVLADADANRRAAEQKEKDRQAELRRREIEAHREEDEAEALRLSEEGRRVAAQAAARAVAFKATRAILDAKVKASEDRAEQAKRADKDLPTRHLVSTTLYKLQTVVSERNSSREELRSLARNKAVNQAERENVRQALLAVSEWYAEQALAFRPVAQVDVLKEMKQREAAKHKREER